MGIHRLSSPCLGSAATGPATIAPHQGNWGLLFVFCSLSYLAHASSKPWAHSSVNLQEYVQAWQSPRDYFPLPQSTSFSTERFIPKICSVFFLIKGEKIKHLK